MGDDEENFCIQTPTTYDEVLTECGDVIRLYDYKPAEDCKKCGGMILEDSTSYNDKGY